MVDLLMLIAFICLAAYLQYKQTEKIKRYNNNLTEGGTLKAPKKTWFFIAMAVMAALVALRAPSIGNDTEEYRKIFINMISDENYISSSRYEIGYLYVNKFVGMFTSDPQVLFVILAIFQYAVFAWFIAKYSDDAAFSLVLFYTIMFGSSMNIVRQVTAMAFILIGVDRLLRKHSIRAFIWLAIAVLFHSSAIVFLVLPIVAHIKFNNIVALIILGAVVVFTATNLLYVISSKLFPSYAHYFSGQYADSGRLAILYQLMRNGVFFALTYLGINFIKREDAVMLYDNAKLRKDKQINLALWCTYIAFVGIIFGFRINLVDRIISYMIFFYIIILPNALKRTNERFSNWIKFIIIVVLLAYSVLVQVIRPEWNTIYPYLFFWQI